MSAKARYSPMLIPAPMDDEHGRLARSHVNRFLEDAAAKYASGPCRLLDVAPQDNGGVRGFFGPHVTIDTLDMDPEAGCTWTADLCGQNPHVPSGHYDIVVCTEVLEHVLQPFKAVAELQRYLRPDGILLVSTPYNYRIHGPLPDCWRFTEHGLRALLDGFEIVKLTPLETPDRPLMPINYTVTARKRAA
jgi:SAM-dependent methyltransferase